MLRAYAQALERQVEEDLSAIPHRTATAQQRVAQLKEQVERKRADLEHQYAALMKEQVCSLYLLLLVQKKKRYTH
jgi:hypothetical protein